MIDAKNEVREAMRNSLPCLSADFLVLATMYLRHFWQKEQQKGIDGNVFEIVSPKLSIVSKLATLAEGSQAAFETFVLFYYIVLRRNLRDSDPTDDVRWLLIRFDEVLLDVAKTCTSVGTLATWRQRLVRGPMFIEHRTLKALNLLPRSLRYMEEAHTCCVFRMLVLKVAGRVLPVELVDMIYLELLAAENCARDDEMEAAWSPIVWPEEAYALDSTFRSTFKSCCGHTTAEEARLYRPSANVDILRWNSDEHCYNRFHAERADKNLPDGLLFLNPLDEIQGWSLEQNTLIYRRCRRMPWTPLEPTTKFGHPPFPFSTMNMEISERERKRIGDGEWRRGIDSLKINMSTDTIDSEFEI